MWWVVSSLVLSNFFVVQAILLAPLQHTTWLMDFSTGDSLVVHPLWVLSGQTLHCMDVEHSMEAGSYLNLLKELSRTAHCHLIWLLKSHSWVQLIQFPVIFGRCCSQCNHDKPNCYEVQPFMWYMKGKAFAVFASCRSVFWTMLPTEGHTVLLELGIRDGFSVFFSDVWGVMTENSFCDVIKVGIANLFPLSSPSIPPLPLAFPHSVCVHLSLV